MAAAAAAGLVAMAGTADVEAVEGIEVSTVTRCSILDLLTDEWSRRWWRERYAHRQSTLVSTSRWAIGVEFCL